MVEGNIETFERDRIVGWVVDPRRPDTPLIISISVNGVQVYHGRAMTFRQDLARVFGDGHHGFEVDMSDRLSARGGRVSIVVEGEEVGLPGATKEFESLGGPGFVESIRADEKIYRFVSALEKNVSAKLPLRSESGQARLHEVLRNTRVILVLFSNRTGSNLVTDMLEQMGCGHGLTNEPLLDTTILTESEKHGYTSVQHYLAEVIDTWTKNGFCFLKVGWDSLFWLTSEGILDPVMTNACLIWTRRHDKLAQAISYYSATSTGQFFKLSDDDAPSARAEQPPLSDEEVLKAIAEMHYQLHVADSRLSYFLSLHGVSALEIYYEDLTRDMAKAYKNIRSHIERCFALKLKPSEFAQPRLKKQGTGSGKMLKEAFLKAMTEPFR